MKPPMTTGTIAEQEVTTVNSTLILNNVRPSMPAAHQTLSLESWNVRAVGHLDERLSHDGDPGSVWCTAAGLTSPASQQYQLVGTSGLSTTTSSRKRAPRGIPPRGRPV